MCNKVISNISPHPFTPLPSTSLPSFSDLRHFSEIRISQGSVATCSRRGGIFKQDFVANLLPSPSVNETLPMLIPPPPPKKKTHGINTSCSSIGWLGSRVVSMLDSRAEGPRFKSQPRRCLVTVPGKLFTPIVPLFAKQQNW